QAGRVRARAGAREVVRLRVARREVAEERGVGPVRPGVRRCITRIGGRQAVEEREEHGERSRTGGAGVRERRRSGRGQIRLKIALRLAELVEEAVLDDVEVVV